MIRHYLNIMINNLTCFMKPQNAARTFKLFVAALLFLNNSALFAAFDQQGAGARAPGMADAFTAVADDADSIAYNPAGLIQLGEGQLTSQYGQLVKGLDDGSSLNSTYVGYAHPLIRGFKSIGFGYHSFNADNLFTERTMTLSYGQRLNFNPLGLGGIWSLGGNLKQLHREYKPDRFTENALNDAGVASNSNDPLFGSGYSKDTYAIDLGGLVQFGDQYQYTAGVAMTNANKPDISLGGDGDKAPQSMRGALGYRPKWGTLTAEMRRTTRLTGVPDQDLLFGAERNIPFAQLGAMIFRGGYASGSRNYKALTFGLSYLYSRFRLDYAFNFPIQALADSQGTHRIGFAYKMGGGTMEQLAKNYSNMDLLEAFAFDSLTNHVLLTRFSLARVLMTEQRDQFMLLLMRKYPLDDPGFKNIRTELKDIIRKAALETLDWGQLQSALTKGVPTDYRIHALEGIELLVKNDAKGALVRMALLPPAAQKNIQIQGISVMALAELSARAYRRNDLDGCIDTVRRILEIIPTDEVVTKAYRELLARRAKISEAYENTIIKEELPEAPQTLTAPKPVGTPTPAPVMSEFNQMVKAFGTSLGYYLTRKSAGAPDSELIGLLNQIKATYGDGKIDMSLVDNELAALSTIPGGPENAPTPQPEPVAIPTPIVPVVVKPIVPVTIEPVVPAAPKIPAEAKPVTKTIDIEPVVEEISIKKDKILTPQEVDSELERAWLYYKTVGARDLTDHERIEILQGMLKRFGERGAGRVLRELERIQRRVQ